MKRRNFSVLGLALIWVGSASSCKPASERPGPRPSPSQRVVSLSPAITDTIAALGARAAVVLVSDYCREDERPRAGTAFSPRFERIASAQPTLILATRVEGAPERELERLGRFVSLPWTTLEEVAASTEELGQLLGRVPEARALSQRLRAELGRTAPDSAPRVLALMGPTSEERAGFFYIKHDSLHGRLLSASGYRNAMGNGPTQGQPHVSVEQVLRADPDAILVLQETPAHGPPPLAGLLPLRAVEHGRTTVLSRAGLLSMGPDVLEGRQLVQAALDRLFREARP